MTECRYPLPDGITPAGSAIDGALQTLVDCRVIEHGIIDAIADRYDDYPPEGWKPEGPVGPTEAPPLALRWFG